MYFSIYLQIIIHSFAVCGLVITLTSCGLGSKGEGSQPMSLGAIRCDEVSFLDQPFHHDIFMKNIECLGWNKNYATFSNMISKLNEDEWNKFTKRFNDQFFQSQNETSTKNLSHLLSQLPRNPQSLTYLIKLAQAFQAGLRSAGVDLKGAMTDIQTFYQSQSLPAISVVHNQGMEVFFSWFHYLENQSLSSQYLLLEKVAEDISIFLRSTQALKNNDISYGNVKLYANWVKSAESLLISQEARSLDFDSFFNWYGKYLEEGHKSLGQLWISLQQRRCIEGKHSFQLHNYANHLKSNVLGDITDSQGFYGFLNEAWLKLKLAGWLCDDDQMSRDLSDLVVNDLIPLNLASAEFFQLITSNLANGPWAFVRDKQNPEQWYESKQFWYVFLSELHNNFKGSDDYHFHKQGYDFLSNLLAKVDNYEMIKSFFSIYHNHIANDKSYDDFMSDLAKILEDGDFIKLLHILASSQTTIHSSLPEKPNMESYLTLLPRPSSLLAEMMNGFSLIANREEKKYMEVLAPLVFHNSSREQIVSRLHKSTSPASFVIFARETLDVFSSMSKTDAENNFLINAASSAEHNSQSRRLRPLDNIDISNIGQRLQKSRGKLFYAFVNSMAKQEISLSRITALLFNLDKEGTRKSIQWIDESNISHELSLTALERLQLLVAEARFLNGYFGAYFINEISRARSYSQGLRSIKQKFKAFENLGFLYMSFDSNLPADTERFVANMSQLLPVLDEIQSLDPSSAQLIQSYSKVLQVTSSPELQNFSIFRTSRHTQMDGHNFKLLEDISVGGYLVAMTRSLRSYYQKHGNFPWLLSQLRIIDNAAKSHLLSQEFQRWFLTVSWSQYNELIKYHDGAYLWGQFINSFVLQVVLAAEEPLSNYLLCLDLFTQKPIGNTAYLSQVMAGLYTQLLQGDPAVLGTAKSIWQQALGKKHCQKLATYFHGHADTSFIEQFLPVFSQAYQNQLFTKERQGQMNILLNHISVPWLVTQESLDHPGESFNDLFARLLSEVSLLMP